MRKVPEHTFSLCSFLYTHPTDKSIRGEIKIFLPQHKNSSKYRNFKGYTQNDMCG